MIIKVNRSRLIEAIKVKRAEALADHQAAKDASSREYAAYKLSVITAVKDFAYIVRAARTVKDITRNLKYGETLRLPESPKEVKGTAPVQKFDDALAKLALSDEEVIQLNDKSDSTFLDLL